MIPTISTEVTHADARVTKKGYSKQKLCAFVLGDGNVCKGIALRGVEFCRHHSGKSIAQRIESAVAVNDPRYKLPKAYQKFLYEKNLSSENIYILKDEVALLQARLQTLIESPLQNFSQQAECIELLRKVIETAKRCESYSKSDDTVKLVINRITVIVNKHCDKDVRLKIARDLFELGKEWSSSQSCSSGDKPVIDAIVSPTVTEDEELKTGKGGTTSTSANLYPQSLPMGVPINNTESGKNI